MDKMVDDLPPIIQHCGSQLRVTLRMCYVLKSDLSSYGACMDEAIKTFYSCGKRGNFESPSNNILPVCDQIKS
jgi:hypothetical protein